MKRKILLPVWVVALVVVMAGQTAFCGNADTGSDSYVQIARKEAADLKAGCADILKTPLSGYGVEVLTPKVILELTGINISYRDICENLGKLYLSFLKNKQAKEMFALLGSNNKNYACVSKLANSNKKAYMAGFIAGWEIAFQVLRYNLNKEPYMAQDLIACIVPPKNHQKDSRFNCFITSCPTAMNFFRKNQKYLELPLN